MIALKKKNKLLNLYEFLPKRPTIISYTSPLSFNYRIVTFVCIISITRLYWKRRNIEEEEEEKDITMVFCIILLDYCKLIISPSDVIIVKNTFNLNSRKYLMFE